MSFNGKEKYSTLAMDRDFNNVKNKQKNLEV